MLDFETTGLSLAAGDRITEVAALRIVDGVVAERYVTLINCGVRMPSFMTALTGISQRMVDNAPPVASVLPGCWISSATMSWPPTMSASIRDSCWPRASGRACRRATRV